MAKFLPFIVEKSTPIHIFQTLVTRSKGMHLPLVTSMLYLIIDKGITVVKEIAAELPEMPLSQVYETLINTYPKYRVLNDEYTKMQSLRDHIAFWYPDKVSKELEEYKEEDTMAFLLVMTMLGKLGDYTSLDLKAVLAPEAEDVQNHIKELKLFSDDGDDYYFYDMEDLRAYIWCHTILHGEKQEVKPVNAILRNDAVSAKNKNWHSGERKSSDIPFSYKEAPWRGTNETH